MTLGLLAKKKGMTRYLNDAGEPVGVTVLEAGPCVVVECKTKSTHGYDAIVVGFGADAKEKRLGKPRAGVFKKRNLPIMRYVREFRCLDASKFTVGQQLTANLFDTGDTVNIEGFTKGRGFQGVIKRCGKHGGPAAHGSHFHRTTGSIGMRTWPGRTLKNTGMPGQMGDYRRTIRNLKVIAVDANTNVILVHGAVPGGRGGLVKILNRDGKFESRVAERLQASASAA